MPKTQLSTRDQITLTLGCLLFFAIALTISGYMAGSETRAKLSALASEGVVVTGTVTDKHINVVGKGKTWVHWLEVRFAGADGTPRTFSANVANSIYDRYAIGSPVQITYVRSRPEWFHVPGAEPTQKDAAIFDGMLQYGAGAAVLLLFGLIGFLCTGRRSGTPTDPAPAVSRLATGAGFSRASGPRAQFGTRRA